MSVPKKSLLIKVAIAVAIVGIILAVVKRNNPKPSLIPAKEGSHGDGLPEYVDKVYSTQK